MKTSQTKSEVCKLAYKLVHKQNYSQSEAMKIAWATWSFASKGEFKNVDYNRENTAQRYYVAIVLKSKKAEFKRAKINASFNVKAA